MTPPDWLWIALTLWAAFAQTIRNATQRHLIASLGNLGATLVRFLYGLPFAVLWLLAVQAVGHYAIPSPNPVFMAWVVLGAVTQIAATALLLRVMTERNFALGVAYSKTDAIQVAVFGLVLLGDRVSAVAAVAIALGTCGVLLLSPADPARPLRALIAGLASRTALLGIASGACFGLSAVGFRGAALALADTAFPMAAAYTLVAAQATQTILLGGWLLARDAAVLARSCREWRTSLIAGAMGAAASAGWFTAMTIESAAHVRTLGLVELLFAYIVSRRILREHLSRQQLSGLVILVAGLVTIAFAR